MKARLLVLAALSILLTTGCATLAEVGEFLQPVAEDAAVAASAEAANQGTVDLQGGEADWTAPAVAAGVAALLALGAGLKKKFGKKPEPEATEE